ncbi:MAG: MFS transporter, partial [Candidatus Hodarchaeota archaeon]
LITSMNIFQYSIYLLVVYLFFSSDLWLIYVNEESTKKTRAFWTNVILAGGVGGPLLLPIFRDMFTQGETLYWRGVPLFGIFLGIPLGILVILTIKETLKFQEIKDIGQAKLNPFTLAKENIREIRKSKHWKEMIMILIMSFCGGLNYNFLSTGQRFLKEYSPYTEDDINSLITIIGISVVLGYLLTGIIADKIGRKPMIIIYSAMLPVSIILVVIGAGLPTGAFYVIPVGYCLSYVSYWGLLSVIRIVTFETLETDKRGTGSGMRGFYYAAGITGGLLIGAGITLISSLGIAYIILSLFVIIDIPLNLKFIKETKGTNLSNIDEEK